jgi:hypothetical protein
MTKTRKSLAAKEAARLMAVVVFPTPPFWLAIAKTLLKRPCYHDSLREFDGAHPGPPSAVPLETRLLECVSSSGNLLVFSSRIVAEYIDCFT